MPKLTERPESLTEVVFTKIRDSIIDKTLPPGVSVSEAGLARDLNVSKTPVREALLRLRELRLVEPLGSRGLRVVIPSSTAIRNAYETRWGLEYAAAGLAAERASEDVRKRILELAEQSLTSAEGCDRPGFVRWDQSFHHNVAEASANAYLSQLTQDAIVLTGALRGRDVPPAGDSVKCGREHVDIAQAIGAGDARLASELAGSHIRNVMTNVLAAYNLASQEHDSDETAGRRRGDPSR